MQKSMKQYLWNDLLLRRAAITILMIYFPICFLLAQTSGGRRVVSVMTYNVHHCNPPEAADVIDVDAIAAVIKNGNADVVAVQEVDVMTSRSGHIDEAQLLAHKAGFKHYYFGKAMDYGGGQYGILILSKYPLKNMQTHLLPKATGKKAGEQRVMATATVVLPGGELIRFGCTHLEAYNEASRILQAKEIMKIANSDSLPFVFAGDLNAHESSAVIQQLDTKFERSCHNCASTFWEGNATGAIDYIYYAPKNAFSVLSHEVIQNHRASDHMPVRAKLQFN